MPEKKLEKCEHPGCNCRLQRTASTAARTVRALPGDRPSPATAVTRNVRLPRIDGRFAGALWNEQPRRPTLGKPLSNNIAARGGPRVGCVLRGKTVNRTIHVVKAGSGYEVLETTEPESTAMPVRCANADALRAALRSMGSTDIGVNNLLKELESYRNAELRL
jgi:hypothetical protein